MKTINRKELTISYLRKLDQQNYLATGIVMLLVVVSVFWMLFHVGGDAVVALYANLIYGIASLIGASFCFLTAYRANRGTLRLPFPHRAAWMLIGAGLLADSIGGFIFTYLAQVGIPNPEPSLSDVGFTLYYPLVFFGLLCMPTRLRFRVRVGLDAFILTLCVLSISWFFAIGPTFVALQTSSPPTDMYTFFVSLSYPFWDMLLILACVLLILQRAESILRPSLLMVIVAIICTTWADTSYAYLTSANVYQSGTPYIDPFWLISSLLIGLAALYQYHLLARHAYNRQASVDQPQTETGNLSDRRRIKPERFFPRSALPYIPFIALLALLLYAESGGHPYPGLGGNKQITFFMALLTAIVGVLIVIRYLLAAHENDVLLRERDERRQNAERLRLASAELSNILDLDGLLNRIVTIAASDLEFDAAMLILIDEYDSPHETPGRLLVRATTAPGVTVHTWQIQEETAVNYAVLAGKEVDVSWQEEEVSLPQEVEDWHQRRGTCTTFFAPVSFQEKIQGCIAFSSFSDMALRQSTHALARSYAEQVGAIIEHNRLYQRTLDKEMFAKAMANIAARLNAALIQPDEVYQLICTEGASALQADYAFFYGFDSKKLLCPLAVYSKEEGNFLPPGEWPPIFPHDLEAQAMMFLQPALMHVDASPTERLFSFPAPAIRASATFSDTSARLPATRALIRYPVSALRQKLLQHGIQRAIFAPLIANEKALGLLILARSLSTQFRDRKPLGMGDLAHTQDFSEQVVVALTNALLYQGLDTAHRQLQKLDQLKDQFMITASHELRTPLTAVQGYIELLAQYDELLPAEQRRDFLQKVQRSCDELVVLLGNVMDASQLEIDPHMQLAHLETVSVRAMIDSVVNLLEPRLQQEQRELLVDIPCELAVQADEGRLRQVLVNISTNALKYSPYETPIAFAARAVTMNGMHTVVISVKDQGQGIPPEAQERLFERFVRLERDLNSPVRGSGLGLYIARRLIEAMHGRIWIESEGIPGEGSTFFIQLQAA